jgi:hypothetical protein
MVNDLQRIDLKVLLDAPERQPFDSVLTAFDRWRQEKDAPSDWVDLADYAHMEQGPAVLMAGKRERFAVDTNEPGPGLLLQNRRDLDGGLEERFAEAFRRHLRLALRLAGEPEWPAAARPRGGDWIVTLSDRLQFPNTDEADAEARPALVALLDKLFAEGYDLERDGDPKRRLAYRLRAEGNPTLAELAAKLG